MNLFITFLTFTTSYDRQDIYTRTELELMHASDLLPSEIARLFAIVGSKVCAPPRTALDLYEQARREPPALQLFSGGMHSTVAFPSRSLIELCGGAGTAKTQCCIQLAATVALCANASVWYVDSERGFTADRFIEIASSHSSAGTGAPSQSMHEVLARVHVHEMRETEQIIRLLDECEERLIEQNVKLIVIDSVAAPARKEFEARTVTSIQARQSMLAKLASRLKCVGQWLASAAVIALIYSVLASRTDTSHNT